MRRAIGRHAGRVGARPVHPIFGGSHHLVWAPSFTTRRFESNLNLPWLDTKWRLRWEKAKLNKELKGILSEMTGKEAVPTTPAKPKQYILPMFPYPSGDLHLGHLRVYTISDVLARFRRMQGHEVLHPIGWDAFGLPAENAAIERGIDPETWTKQNIKKMKSQLETMNGQWDWDREFATCNPTFYKHTQQLFLLLHKAGLAYQAESLVNYDPVDKTVLANEQVDANGFSWRSGAKVEKKLLKQWFFKISAFRQELLDDLGKLEESGAWPERVLAMQKNWLGKSTGARIKFPVVVYDQQAHSDIEVFTTRPDTIFGVQYIALASNHPIVKSLAKSDAELQAFLDTITALPTDSKVGYLLPHVRALNPVSYEESTPDAAKASLPIYVAPYVLGDYGDGAVMGVPGHDTRDHTFWKHNRYDDPVRVVISQSPDESTSALKNEPFIHHGYLTHHSGPYAGLTTARATEKIVALLQSKELGSAAETWRLRDWLISRQRYWGTPIPIIHCDSCGPVPVPDDQLPVELPHVKGHWAKGRAGNPLEQAHDWINTKCPECGGSAKRDTDTMDTFVDSSWYFMRFPDPENFESPFSADAANTNLPVDVYIGGVEHAILHLLYARFISKFIATTPLWPNGSKYHGEPFKKVLTQGMVHGKTYSDPSTGRFLKPDEVDLTNPSKPLVVATNQIANVSFEKMSKSKYNGVDPGTCMAKYGADATRAHILFQAPVSEVLEWDEEKIAGITRWLRRLHEGINQHSGLWGFVATREFNPKLYFLDPPVVSSVKRSEQPPSFFHPILTRFGVKKPSPHDTLPDPLTTQLIPKIERAWAMGFERDKQLWRSVQGTIASVTESYERTYSLNTVVSDLMALTNTILEYNIHFEHADDGTVFLPDHRLLREAYMALVKMMAPITPAFAEECWEILNPNTTVPNAKIGGLIFKVINFLRSGRDQNTPEFRAGVPIVPTSIFDQPFPTEDATFDMLAPATQKCAVQINGKLRAAVEIPIPPTELKGEELQNWIVKEILATEDGKTKFMGSQKDGKKMIDIRKAKKVIVVKGGKTVNFVL